MWHKTFALLVRSLRTSARDVREHLFRFAVVLTVAVVLTTTVAATVAVGAPGLRYFSLVATCNFWFITLAGASFFAASITEEREEGTLSLLKLAGMGPVSILTGKALPLLISAILFLTIQYPFTVLAITLGGVTWWQVLATYLALLAHLILVAGTGILISVMSRRTATACARAGGLWLSLMIVSRAVSRLPSSSSANSLLTNVVLSALETANLWFHDNFAASRVTAVLAPVAGDRLLSSQVVSNILLGAASLVLAALIFNRATANDSEDSTAGWWRRVRRRSGRRQRAWHWAIAGKDFAGTGGWLAFGARAALIPAVAIFLAWASHGYQWSRISQSRDGLMDWVFRIALFALAVETAIQSARVFRNETALKTWSTLSLLPQSTAAIAGRKVLGTSLCLLPAALLATTGLLFGDDFWDLTGGRWQSGDVAFLVYLGLQVVFWIHVAAIFSISLRWAVWPAALFLATFAGVIGVILLVSFLSQVLRYPGPSSCAGILWTLVFSTIVSFPVIEWMVVRQLRSAAARD